MRTKTSWSDNLAAQILSVDACRCRLSALRDGLAGRYTVSDCEAT